jgi:hypothetical protein
MMVMYLPLPVLCSLDEYLHYPDPTRMMVMYLPLPVLCYLDEYMHYPPLSTKKTILVEEPTYNWKSHWHNEFPLETVGPAKPDMQHVIVKTESGTKHQKHVPQHEPCHAHMPCDYGSSTSEMSKPHGVSTEQSLSDPERLGTNQGESWYEAELEAVM